MYTQFSLRQNFGVVTLMVLLGVVLVACGGGSSPPEASSANRTEEAIDSTSAERTEDASNSASNGDGLDPAREILREATEPNSTFVGPTTPVEPTPGKTVAIIHTFLAAEADQFFQEGASAAVNDLGWNEHIIDGKGTPDGYVTAIRQALTQRVDGVIMLGIDTNLVKAELEELKAEGIPVLAASNTNPPGDLFAANIGYDTDRTGKYYAAAVAVDSGGDAKVAVLNDPAYGVVVEFAEYFEQYLGELCASCEIVNRTNIQVTELGSELGPKVKAILQANPSVDYIWVGYDAAVPDIVNAIHQAGLAGEVKVVSQGGTQVALDYLRNKDTLIGDAAVAHGWMGYAAVDTMQRLFSDVPLDPDGRGLKTEGLKWLTWDNVPAEGNWDGDVDYQAEYRKLWGIER